MQLRTGHLSLYSASPVPPEAPEPRVRWWRRVLVPQGDGTVAYPASALVKVPAGSGTVYVGGSTVSAATGFPLAAGEALEVDMVNEALYAVATVTTTVHMLRRFD